MNAFLDTSVLLAGLVDFGPQSRPAQDVLHAIANRRVASPMTAWHCCLEFYSVSTRLPPEFRLTPADAQLLLREEIFDRMAVHDLPLDDRANCFQAAVHDRIVGGRIYDLHIAHIARAAGAGVIVTDNRRHFLASLKDGVQVVTPSEFLAGLKGRRG